MAEEDFVSFRSYIQPILSDQRKLSFPVTSTKKLSTTRKSRQRHTIEQSIETAFKVVKLEKTVHTLGK